MVQCLDVWDLQSFGCQCAAAEAESLLISFGLGRLGVPYWLGLDFGCFGVGCGLVPRLQVESQDLCSQGDIRMESTSACVHVPKHCQAHTNICIYISNYLFICFHVFAHLYLHEPTCLYLSIYLVSI